MSGLALGDVSRAGSAVLAASGGSGRDSDSDGDYEVVEKDHAAGVAQRVDQSQIQERMYNELLEKHNRLLTQNQQFDGQIEMYREENDRLRESLEEFSETLKQVKQDSDQFRQEKEQFRAQNKEVLEHNSAILVQFRSLQQLNGKLSDEKSKVEQREQGLQARVQILETQNQKLQRQMTQMQIARASVSRVAVPTVVVAPASKMVRELSLHCHKIGAVSVDEQGGKKYVNFGFGVWFEVKGEDIEKAKGWKGDDVLELSHRSTTWEWGNYDVLITNQRSKETLRTIVHSCDETGLLSQVTQVHKETMTMHLSDGGVCHFANCTARKLRDSEKFLTGYMDQPVLFIKDDSEYGSNNKIILRNCANRTEVYVSSGAGTLEDYVKYRNALKEREEIDRPSEVSPP